MQSRHRKLSSEPEGTIDLSVTVMEGRELADALFLDRLAAATAQLRHNKLPAPTTTPDNSKVAIVSFLAEAQEAGYYKYQEYEDIFPLTSDA